MYLDGHDFWFENKKPQKKEDCLIIVLRKAHAFIVSGEKFMKMMNRE